MSTGRIKIHWTVWDRTTLITFRYLRRDQKVKDYFLKTTRGIKEIICEELEGGKETLDKNPPHGTTFEKKEKISHHKANIS
jgi:hypothetical protein